VTQTSSSRARSAGTKTATGIGIGIALALLLPRIVRMVYPEVWVEDDFYLESAYLVSVGMRPYLDFVHPHPPLLEWVAAGFIHIFGASHLSLEFLNEAAIYLTSILLFALGDRVAGRRVAIASVILYGLSSLVFRYHVYERECFIAPLVVGAAILVLREDYARSWRRDLAIAILLTLACAIKLTSVIPAAITLGYVALANRQIARAVRIGAVIMAGIGLLSLFCYWRYGFEFVFQTFMFHFMKGRDAAGQVALYPRLILDLLAPLFVLGLIEIAVVGVPTTGTWFIVAMVAGEYVFFGLFSPTAWGHNYLEVVAFIAIVAAMGASRLLSSIRAAIVEEVPRRSAWRWLIGGGALMLVALVWLTPLVNENWLRDSVYGFGFIPRAEMEQVAKAVRDASAPGDNVVAPSFICFEANRPELIRYPETYGVYREAEAEYERFGFIAARARLGSADFFGLIEQTAGYWTSQITDAVKLHRAKVVVSDSRIQLLPLVSVPQEMLVQNSYRPVLRTEHYVVWTF